MGWWNSFLSWLWTWLHESTCVIRWYKIIHTQCTNVNSLVLIFVLKLSEMEPVGETGGRTHKPLSYLCNFLWIYNYFKIKKLNPKRNSRNKELIEAPGHHCQGSSIMIRKWDNEREGIKKPILVKQRNGRNLGFEDVIGSGNQATLIDFSWEMTHFFLQLKPLYW